LIRLACLGSVRPIEEVLASLDSPGPAPRQGEGRQKKKRVDSPRQGTREATAAAQPPTEPQPARGAAAAAPRLVEAIQRTRPILAAMLDQAEVRLGHGKLAIRFPPDMEAVRRQVETRPSLALLKQEAERLTGGPVEIRVVACREGEPEPKPAPTAEPEPSPKRRAPAPSPAATSRPAPKRPGDLLEQARREPGVQELMDAFGAHVVDIRSTDLPAKPKRPGKKTRPPEDAP